MSLSISLMGKPVPRSGSELPNFSVNVFGIGLVIGAEVDLERNLV